MSTLCAKDKPNDTEASARRQIESEVSQRLGAAKNKEGHPLASACPHALVQTEYPDPEILSFGKF